MWLQWFIWNSPTALRTEGTFTFGERCLDVAQDAWLAQWGSLSSCYLYCQPAFVIAARFTFIGSTCFYFLLQMMMGRRRTWPVHPLDLTLTWEEVHCIDRLSEEWMLKFANYWNYCWCQVIRTFLESSYGIAFTVVVKPFSVSNCNCRLLGKQMLRQITRGLRCLPVLGPCDINSKSEGHTGNWESSSDGRMQDSQMNI